MDKLMTSIGGTTHAETHNPMVNHSSSLRLLRSVRDLGTSSSWSLNMSDNSDLPDDKGRTPELCATVDRLVLHIMLVASSQCAEERLELV